MTIKRNVLRSNKKDIPHKYSITAHQHNVVGTEHHARLARDHLFYIDTIHLWFRYIPMDHILRLLQMCDPENSFHTFDERLEGQPWFKAKLVLHRPQPAAFHFLEKNYPRALMTAAHVAFDLIVDDQEDAKKLQDFFNRHFVKQWPGKQQIGACEDTLYASLFGRTVENNVAIYSQRPSKMNGRPCTHIEWRAQSARAIRKVLGVKVPTDLIRFQHRAFWRRKLVLKKIDLGKLVLARRGTKRRKVLKADLRQSQIIAQAVAREHALHGRYVRYLDSAEPYCRSKLLSASEKRRCISRIENTLFIPKIIRKILLNHR